MRAWLLDKRIAPDVERALRHRPSAELEAVLRKRVATLHGDASSVLTVAGTEAEISVRGVLVEQYDWWLEYACGGCTGYEDIRAAIDTAEADPNVKRVVFAVSSPGGEAAGLHVTIQRIEAMQKSSLTRANLALSAAYGIAAATDRIEAESAASEFGCLGVAIEYVFYADQEIVTVVNTESPDKRPDPRTAEGKKTIQAHNDAIYAWYADGIARGRETTLDDVNANFGRGAVLTAPDAKKRGMIDGYAAQRARAVRAGASAQALSSIGASAHAGHARARAATPVAWAPTMNPGDRVRVKPGMEHEPDLKEAVGTIRNVGTAALGIEFDNMPGEIHRWFVEDEVEHIDDSQQQGDGMSSLRHRSSRTHAAARAQSNPEPGAPEATDPVTGKDTDIMNPKLIAQLLGLSADASVEALEAGVAALAQAKKDADAALSAANDKHAKELKTANDVIARFETALGEKGDAAFGALDAHLANSKKLAEVEATLATQAKAADDAKRATLIEKGKADSKLTPALIELYSAKPTAELEAYLKVAPVVVPEAHKQPAGGSGGDSAVLKHNGKTYAEMTNPEREALYRDDESLFNQMRAQSQKKR